jgi:hypothetical protein
MKVKVPLYCTVLLMTGMVAYAQPKKKDTLLSFTGNWQSGTIFKADINYITGQAVGGNVTVNKDGSVTVQSQAGQKLNQAIDQGTSQVDQLESQVKQDLVTSEGLNEYHLYKFSQGAIDSAKAFYFGLKETAPPPGGTSSNPTYQQYNNLANWCISQADDYNSIISFYQAHRRDKTYDYPPPPLADYFNCWGCNRDAQKAFDKQCKDYDTIFFQPELGLLQKAVALLRPLTLLAQTGENVAPTPDMQNMINSLFKHSKSNPQNNGPCAFMDAGLLMQAEAFLAQRCVNKANQFAQDVIKQKNYNASIPAVRVYLDAEGQLEKILGTDQFTNGNLGTIFEACRTVVENLLTALTDKITQDHDISYLSDIPLMLSLSAQDEMVGGNGGGFIDLLNQITRYTLSLDLNVKTSMQGGVTQTAHLQGTAEMVVELDTVACVRMVLSNTENGVFTATVQENSMSTPNCTPSYVGTKTYTMPAPLLILHFCGKGGADTLTLGRFGASPANAGLWRIPCGAVPPQNMGINGLDGYFLDPTTMKNNAMNIKANAGAYQGQLQQMLAQARQIQAQLQSQMGGTGGMNSPGTATAMKSAMDMNNNVAPVDLVNMARLEIPITLNNAALIINQTVDAKQTNTSQMTQVLDHGLYKIQLKQKAQ